MNDGKPWAEWVEGINDGVVCSRIAVHYWDIRQLQMLTEQTEDAWRQRPHLQQHAFIASWFKHNKYTEVCVCLEYTEYLVSGVRASLVFPRSSAYTPRACYPYYCMASRPGLSYKLIGKDWIPSMYDANDVSCTSAGTTSCPTTRFW